MMKKNLLDIIDNEHLEKLFVILVLAELVFCSIDAGTNTTYKIFVNCYEFFIISLFTVEYVLRLFTMDKLRHALRPMMIVDLLTILPVSGVFFFSSLIGSSALAVKADKTSVTSIYKKMPPSSLWSVIAAGIYWYDYEVPLSTAMNFLNTLYLGISSHIIEIILCASVIVLLDMLRRKMRAFELKEVALQQEFP